jgi:hypothetical protein
MVVWIVKDVNFPLFFVVLCMGYAELCDFFYFKIDIEKKISIFYGVLSLFIMMTTTIHMKLITQDNGKHCIQVCVPDNPDFYLPENISESVREMRETQRQSQKGLTKRGKEKLKQQGLSEQEIEKKDIETKKQQISEVAMRDYITLAGIRFFREIVRN